MIPGFHRTGTRLPAHPWVTGIEGSAPSEREEGVHVFEDLPILTVVIVLAVVAYVLLSFSYIGPTEVGLVIKRLGRRLDEGHVIAFKREAGYQAGLLMPGLR